MSIRYCSYGGKKGLLMEQNDKIFRIPEHPPKADQSAVGAINRPLLDGWMVLFICIIRNRSAGIQDEAP